MNLDRDAESWIALSLIGGLGNESFRRLLVAFGEPGSVFQAPQSELAAVVKSSVAKSILAGPDQQALSATLSWLDDPANSIVTLADSDYPKALLEIPDPPPLLYLKGNRSLLSRRCFAMVGSRNATPQGLINAEAFARALSESGFCVVSGLAVGIDSAAHRGGLAGASKSLAVVGTGLDIVYPARNRDLAHELADHGALLSEFPLGTPAIGGNFPRRNRIISGLAEGVLVVEAGLRSGSLITARHALEQGRDVFAIPGSIHSPLSKGPHLLIKQGAKLVESAQDVLEELGARSLSGPQSVERGEPDVPVLLLKMGYDMVDADTLAARADLPIEAVSSQLLQLELDGWVKGYAGGLYQRLH